MVASCPFTSDAPQAQMRRKVRLRCCWSDRKRRNRDGTNRKIELPKVFILYLFRTIAHTPVYTYRPFRVFAPGVVGGMPPRPFAAMFAGFGRGFELPQESNYSLTPRLYVSHATVFGLIATSFAQWSNVAGNHR